jgi:hypothetical protein
MEPVNFDKLRSRNKRVGMFVHQFCGIEPVRPIPAKFKLISRGRRQFGKLPTNGLKKNTQAHHKNR